MGFFKDLLRNGWLGHHGQRGRDGHHGYYGGGQPYGGAPAATGRSCPSCNALVATGANFCGQCGTSVMPATCGQCGTTLAADARFCGQCGQAAAR